MHAHYFHTRQRVNIFSTLSGSRFYTRSAVKAVLEKVTSNAYYYTARGLFERDRFIFALLMAIEVRFISCVVLFAKMGINVIHLIS